MTANRVQPWLDDGDVQLYHGDATTILQGLPAGIAQTCVTSPPYWGLRDYGATGQLGLEATPDLYVERLVAVFREVRRVLRDDGTLWLNLGDSYMAAQGGRQSAAGAMPTEQKQTNNEPRDRPGLNHMSSWCSRDVTAKVLTDRTVGLKPKDLAGMPWRVAFALQADGWYLRSDIIWSKPNPMPESVSDRPTKSHEYLFLFSKQPRYFYDADAIREPHETADRNGDRRSYQSGSASSHRLDGGHEAMRGSFAGLPLNAAGRNRRSVWTIPTEPFPEAHFATYPQELVRPCILAGTSEHGGCVECGAPWRRLLCSGGIDDLDLNRHQARHAKSLFEAAGLGQRHIDAIRAVGIADTGKALVTTNGAGHNADQIEQLATEARFILGGYYREFLLIKPGTAGWEPSCFCDASAAPTIPQLVLDPFIGSGTTALVARKHGRRCTGIDLSAEYLEIAAKRTQQLSLLGGVA